MQPLTEKMAYGKPVISQEEFTQVFPVSIETLLSLSQVLLFSLSHWRSCLMSFSS